MVRGILNRMVMKNLKDEAKNMILKDGLIDYFYVHILMLENLDIQIIAELGLILIIIKPCITGIMKGKMNLITVRRHGQILYLA